MFLFQLAIFGCFIGTIASLLSNERRINGTQNLLPRLNYQMIAKEVELVNNLIPLKKENFIMFWRPQKVGSSTILSILLSYGYRYNIVPKRKNRRTSMCVQFAKCALDSAKSYDSTTMARIYSLIPSNTIPGSNGALPHKKIQQEAVQEMKGNKKSKLSNSLNPFRISLDHEVCNLNGTMLQENLFCAFKSSFPSQVDQNFDSDVKEIFLVRNPISRAISVYYFWGELYKVKKIQKSSPIVGNLPSKRETEKLGFKADAGHVQGALFNYHGNEKTVPPLKYALEYAERFPYKKQINGPSFTWSLFASDPNEAVSIIQSDRMVTLVLERLDESLIVARHYLNWSLADIVVTMYRKALSSHPKYHEWPSDAIDLIKTKLNNTGEYAIYNASNHKLNERIENLKSKGVNVHKEVQQLKELKSKVSPLCTNETYLENYRKDLVSRGFFLHPAENRLRDVDEKFERLGHMFSFNREILGTFDVCGACESHALLLGIKLGRAVSITNSTTLFELPEKYRINNVDFQNCPKQII